MATYRYLRIRFFEPAVVQTSSIMYRISGVEVLNGETPIDLSGATITASASGGTLSGAVANLTDSDDGTYLGFDLANFAVQTPYIDIDLGSVQAVTGVAIKIHSSEESGIGKMSVFGWVGGQWNTTYADHVYYSATQAVWGTSERRVFDWALAEGKPNYRYYRITVETCAGSSSTFGIMSEVGLYYGPNGLPRGSGSYRSLFTTGGTSAPGPENLFDSNYANNYHWGGGDGPHSVTVDFGGPLAVDIVVLNLLEGYESSAISTGAISGSNDGSTWDTLATFNVGAPSTYDYYLEMMLELPAGAPDFVGYLAAAVPCATVRAAAAHDFTAAIGSAVSHYVMDLTTPGGTVRVPISSWQATLQTDAQCYVQCVVPACTPWLDAINTATTFTINRRAALASGDVIEYEMAASALEQVDVATGPTNATATLSGYSPALAADETPPKAYDRTLQAVRSINSGSSGIRVRCAIDWLLRPGHRAYVGDAPLIVSYANYYVTSSGDQYMDVGERV